MNTMYPQKQTQILIALFLSSLAAVPAHAGEPPPVFGRDRNVAVSSDGRMLAYGSDSITLVNAENGRTARVITGCGCEIEQLAFSQDGQYVMGLASVCSDTKPYTEARVWSVATGKIRLTVKGPDDGAAGFLTNGDLAVRSDHHHAALWSVGSRRRRRVVPANQITFGADGRAALIAKQIPEPLAEEPQREYIGIAPNGRGIVTIDRNAASEQNSLVTVWDAKSSARIVSRLFPRTPLYTATLGGNSIAIGGRDLLILWDMKTGATQQFLTPQSGQGPGWFEARHITWTALANSGKIEYITTSLHPIPPNHGSTAVWYGMTRKFSARTVGEAARPGFTLKDK